MGAVREQVVGLGEATFTLVELHNGGVNFVLVADGSEGYCWYLPNPDGPAEQEDWVFHALRHGKASSLEEAVNQLASAAVREFPDSSFGQMRSK